MHHNYKNKREKAMTVNEARLDLARRNKEGISFMLASVVLWTGILIIWLLPFAWLCNSRAYLVMAVVIPIVSLGVGINFSGEHIFIIPALMLFIEMVFAAWLAWENKCFGKQRNIMEGVEL